MKILVTGGAGFIGSHFIRKLLSVNEVQEVLVIDNLTYAGRIENLFEFEEDSRFSFVKGDIRDSKILDELINEKNFIVNFAAESHVDRSIADSSNFIGTNIVGTHTLLEAVKNEEESVIFRSQRMKFTVRFQLDTGQKIHHFYQIRPIRQVKPRPIYWFAHLM